MKASSVVYEMSIWNVWSVGNPEKSEPFTKLIKDSGFDIHHAFRENKKGGGVAIIYRNDLSVKNGDESSSHFLSFEYCWVTLTLNLGRKLVIVCVCIENRR